MTYLKEHPENQITRHVCQTRISKIIVINEISESILYFYDFRYTQIYILMAAESKLITNNKCRILINFLVKDFCLLKNN